MPSANLRLLTSQRWQPVAAAHRDWLTAGGAGAEVCAIGEEIEHPERLGDMVERWSELCLSAGLTTRYNDPQRVMRWLTEAAKDGGGPGTVEPYVVLGELGESAVVIVGELGETGALDALPLALPLIDRVGPTITTMEISETALVVRPGPELDELCALVVRSLLAEGVLDRLRIRNLPRQHPATPTLDRWRQLGARGVSEDRIRWFAQMLDTETGERVDLHSSKTRWTFRKLDRKLVEAFDGDAELERVTSVEGVDDFIRAATGIARSTYQASLGIGVKDTAEYRAFLREMAEAGGLRGYVLRGKGEPIAYVLGDRWGTTFSLWATSFLPRHGRLSPGIVAMRRVMESLASEGVASFDFGWGEAEYKKKLGDHHRDEADFTLYARRLAPTLAYAVTGATGVARAGAKTAIERLGLRHRVRALWRRRLARS